MLVPHLHIETKKGFVISSLFLFQATATYPDGNRVPNLKFSATVTIDGPPEQILDNEGWGNDMGDVAMSFQIPPQAKHLAVTVRFYMIIILLYPYFHSKVQIKGIVHPKMTSC